MSPLNLQPFHVSAAVCRRWSLRLALVLTLPQLAMASFTCGNDAQTKTTCPGECGSADFEVPAGTACPPGSEAGENQFHFYNGNVSRSVVDLALFAGLEGRRMEFKRHFSSRASTPPYLFGSGTVWRHSFQYDLSDDANGWVKLTDNRGDRVFFARSSSDPNVWKTHRTDGTARIYQNGNNYNYRTADGWQLEFFRETGSSGAFYRLLRMRDPENRVYPFFYNSIGQLSRISDPAGNYSDLSWVAAPVTGDTVLSSVSTNDGRSVSYVYDTMTKASTPNHTVLKEANYGDQTKAQYTYAYEPTRTGIQPYLMLCDDPRVTGKATRMKYSFLSQFYGMVVKESNPDDNSVLVERFQNGTDISVVYADGSSQTWQAPTGSQGLSPTFTNRTGETTARTFTTGRLTGETLPSGLTLTRTYDGIGRLLKTTGSDGLVVEMTYDAMGRKLTEKRSATGYATRLTTWTRNTSGLVTRLDYPNATFETWTYDANGQPLTHRLPNGANESWTYNGDGTKLTHTDGAGAVTSWTYTAAADPGDAPAGLVRSITDPRNRTTTYDYNERGLLSSITYPDTSSKIISYDDYGNKEAEMTSAGDLTEWTYNNFRLMHTMKDGINRITTYQYGPNGTACGCATKPSPTLIIRPDGTTIARTYQASERLMSETIGANTSYGQTTSFGYDTAGRRTGMLNPNGIVTSYTYDLRSRPASRTADAGGLNLTTSWIYDPFGNQISERLPSVSGASRLTTTTYGVMDRPALVTDPLGMVTSMAWNAGGRLASMTRAHGTTSARITQYAYDARMRPTVTTHPDGTTTSRTYYLDGTVASITHELNHTTLMDSGVTTWTDSAAVSHTSFADTVTDALNYTSTSFRLPMAERSGTTCRQSAEGRVQENLYDAAGQLAFTRTAPGTADATLTAYGYDLLGRQTSSTIDPTGLNETTSRLYDAIGRPVSTTDPLNHTTFMAYTMAVTGDALDARTREIRTTTLPDSRQESVRLDSLGRTIATTDAKNQTSAYGYWYETGNMTTLHDSRSNDTLWTYNLRGQLLTKTYPNSDLLQYTYDTLARLATHTTPKNEICTYTYDLRDRLLLSDWNTTTPDTARTYWNNGFLKSIDNSTSRSDYLYTVRNELFTETQTLAGRPARVVGYGYDADGLRTGLAYPNSRVVSLAWNARAQLGAVSADGPPPVASYVYDTAGRLTDTVHENGITEHRAYDAAGRLLSNSHLAGTTLQSGHGYVLDDTGRRTDETFADGTTPARTYGYDNANQVTAADYGTSLTDAYNYDSMGNRLTASVASQGGSAITYTANSANQYTALTAQPAPTHDANGNLTTQNGITYTWDSHNRLLSLTPTFLTVGDKSYLHTYDGQHRRVTRTLREWTPGGWTTLETTHFIYDGWNVIEEIALGTSPSSNTLTRLYTWGTDLSGTLQGAGGVGGLLMAEELSGTTSTAYHYHYDGNGNVTEITTATGAAGARYRYDAFGNTLSATGPYAATNCYRFSTKPLDGQVTGAPLYYYGYRYYDPLNGRWINRDPIGERGGINLYGMVGNSPVTELDYLGLKILMSEEDQELYDKAKKYLSKCPEFAALIKALEESEKIVILDTNNEDENNYNPNESLVNWDPGSGMETSNGGVQSPAMGLGHELAHAAQHISNPEQYNEDRKRGSDRIYGKREERRVIEGIECSCAEILGEGTRQDHEGKPIRVEGPTTLPPSRSDGWHPGIGPTSRP